MLHSPAACAVAWSYKTVVKAVLSCCLHVTHAVISDDTKGQAVELDSSCTSQQR